MHHEAIDLLGKEGYVAIGMDHFALQDDSLVKAKQQDALHRNFQGYTTHNHCELIGLGVSAIGDINHFLYQNEKNLDQYYERLDQSCLPIVKGLTRTDDDVIRENVIMSLMCTGEVDKQLFEEDTSFNFDHYFSVEQFDLGKFVKDGLLISTAEMLKVSPKGMHLIRNVAMTFDIYRCTTGYASKFSKIH